MLSIPLNMVGFVQLTWALFLQIAKVQKKPMFITLTFLDYFIDFIVEKQKSVPDL